MEKIIRYKPNWKGEMLVDAEGPFMKWTDGMELMKELKRVAVQEAQKREPFLFTGIDIKRPEKEKP